jgi:CRP/FNR family transcriptional regulator, cyclic AMP receptor protein
MALTASKRAHLLSGVGLFAAAGPKGRAAIARRAEEVDFPKGQRIARQGEIETGFFMIVAGSVTVARDGKTLARLGPGDFFGELSLLDRQPRMASVTADEPTHCLALPSWEFQQLLDTEPGLAVAILKEAAKRLRAAAGDEYR